jgi:hypothetical protein
MKKLNSSLCIILLVISAFSVTSCGKGGDGDSGGGGGIIVLLGDLIGFWQSSSNDSFTFNDNGGQLGGVGTVGGRSGTVSNGVTNKTVITFNLTFDDNHSVKSYQGTIDATKKILKLTSAGITETFNKQ